MFENPRRGRQARNFGKNVPKIVDLKSSSEQIFSENCRWVPLVLFPYCCQYEHVVPFPAKFLLFVDPIEVFDIFRIYG